MAPPRKYPQLHDLNWLREQDAAGLGASDIARILGCTLANVSATSKKLGFQFESKTAPQWRPKRCATCGEEFSPGSGVQKWCSDVCRVGGLTTPCEHCGSEFEESLTGAKAKRMPGRKYCSTRCRNLAVHDKPHGRYVDSNGYVRITTPDGRRMSEHRYVMEQAIGRPLEADETVHHKNDIRHENDLSNLQLRRGNHGPGACFRCRSCGSHDVEAVPL